MPPRRRTKANEKLPPYVYRKLNRYVITIYDPDTRRQTDRRLCSAEASMSEVWAAYDAYRGERHDTLNYLLKKYHASPQFVGLAESTKRDYNLCADAITTRRTKSKIPLGELSLSKWTPGLVRKYMDRRGEESISRANHELRFLKALFSWAKERDLCRDNPAKGVRQIKQPPRQRYVTDAEYESVLTLAAQSGSPYVAVIMELAYLCRLRLSEVLDLQRKDELSDGLYAARRKGSKDAITGWSPRLAAAVAASKALHGKLSSIYLIPGASGGRMRESTVQTAWQRLMKTYGGERFTLHDLKRKGVSDFDGDKLAASGHRSAAMLKIYDVLPSKIGPTR